MCKHFLLLSIALLAIPLSLSAAPSNSQEQEYQQVRKIALRDPKFRAAYEEADQRLEGKIVQIDPALKTYVKTRASGSVPPAPQKDAKLVTAKKQTPRTTHVVAKNETLGSIASRYGVTVAALKTTNQIQDERKLRAGQALTIPHTQSP